MIERILVALPEPQTRLARLAEWLNTHPDEVVVRTLAEVVERADAHEKNAQIALLSLVNVRTVLSYERLVALYIAADEAALPRVKQLFVAGAASKVIERGATVSDNPFLEKTLGERKALAMSTNRDIIDRLMRDRHPHVIAILLRNPRITERDVVRIAAQQPTTIAVIEAIVCNYKWLQSYEIKKAIVFNPYTPRNMARTLMPTLLEVHRDDARRLLFDRDEV